MEYSVPESFWAVIIRSLSVRSFWFCAWSGPRWRVDALSGTVKDPSGLPVAGARIEITGENLALPLMVTSDQSGNFSAADLKPGSAVQTASGANGSTGLGRSECGVYGRLRG